MGKSFIPASISTISEIDRAKVPYDDVPVVIEGIVSPKGQGGWPGRNEDYKVHTFTLAAWRRGSGLVIEKDLLVLKPLPADAEYEWDHFPQYSTQRLRVLRSVDLARAILLEELPTGLSDESLESVARKLQEPVIISTELFGDLVLDRRLNWFTSEAVWNGAAVEITFDTDEDGSIERTLDTAKGLWAEQEMWKKRIDDFAVQRMLTEVWLDENEPEVSADEFISRMKLESIAIHPEGKFTFWHDDGDLFWGHAIEVRGNLKDGPTEAGIAG